MIKVDAIEPQEGMKSVGLYRFVNEKEELDKTGFMGPKVIGNCIGYGTFNPSASHNAFIFAYAPEALYSECENSRYFPKREGPVEVVEIDPEDLD